MYALTICIKQKKTKKIHKTGLYLLSANGSWVSIFYFFFQDGYVGGQLEESVWMGRIPETHLMPIFFLEHPKKEALSDRVWENKEYILLKM